MSADAQRIRELERTVEELRRRLLALATVLPLEYLPCLELDAEAIELAVVPARMWDGWEETSRLTRSDVATELGHLWRRLSPPGRP